MPTVTSHTYIDPKDLQIILDLLLSVRPPGQVSDYPGIADLREMLSSPAIQANTRCWFAEGGQAIAFALVDSYNNLLYEIQHLSASPSLHAEMINWGVECIQRSPHEIGEILTLDASCRAEDFERIALLKQHGFVIQPLRSLHLTRSLNDPIPEPILPEGFSIRPTTGQDEVEEWVLLHQAAFGTTHMTVEERLAMMSGPDYDPQIDLIATAPDGRLAAYCMCQIRREENLRTGRNEGYTDPLATHPDFQRRGLARALLSSGLQLLKGRSIETALLGTSNENELMQSLAKALGFRVESSKVWFSKPIND